MYSRDRLYETCGSNAVPFTMALAIPTYADVDAIINRADGLTYRPDIQRNENGGTAMASSTCSRRNSTGLFSLDNDRTQDD